MFLGYDSIHKHDGTMVTGPRTAKTELPPPSRTPE